MVAHFKKHWILYTLGIGVALYFFKIYPFNASGSITTPTK